MVGVLSVAISDERLGRYRARGAVQFPALASLGKVDPVEPRAVSAGLAPDVVAGAVGGPYPVVPGSATDAVAAGAGGNLVRAIAAEDRVVAWPARQAVRSGATLEAVEAASAA